MKKFLLLALTALMIFPVYSQQKSKAELLDEYLDHLFQNDKFMGSVAVSVDGEIDFAKAYGWADIDGNDKVESDEKMKYRIGSISKMFTSTMIYQLIEEQKLEHTTLLKDFYPGLENSDMISIEQMLNHSSGISNFTAREDYFDWCYEEKSKKELINLIIDSGSDFEPGSTNSYSNSNYVLLGFILEDVTGKDFNTNLQERICRPLGLGSTSFGGEIRVDKGDVHSFSIGSEWIKSEQTNMSVPQGAGSLTSTPIDLCVFIEALFDGKLINESSLEHMTTVSETGYGHGIFPNTFYESTGYGHSGGIDNFISNLCYYKELGISVAITTNGLNYDSNEIIVAIMSFYNEMDYELPEFKSFDIPKEKIPEFVGSYYSEELGMTFNVVQSDQMIKVLVTGQPEIYMEAISETEWKNDVYGVVMEFKDKEKGKFTTLVNKQAGYEFTFKRTEVE